MPEDPIAEMLRQAAEYKRAEQEARREASDMTHESFLHVRDHAAEQYERLLGRVEERVERLRASVLPVAFEIEREGNRLDVVCAPIRLRLRFRDRGGLSRRSEDRPEGPWGTAAIRTGHTRPEHRLERAWETDSEPLYLPRSRR